MNRKSKIAQRKADGKKEVWNVKRTPDRKKKKVGNVQIKITNVERYQILKENYVTGMTEKQLHEITGVPMGAVKKNMPTLKRLT
ncbi:hypothetical protein [Maribacter sp. 2210JD10-5]|uniref:hypothetical protein n=1 Tax=Maribacter sp. 2210JD10-5 TaxID=3386272 RepID=UPI0039BD44CF